MRVSIPITITKAGFPYTPVPLTIEGTVYAGVDDDGEEYALTYHENDVDNLVSLDDGTDILFTVSDDGHDGYNVIPDSGNLVPVSEVQQVPYDTVTFEMGLRNVQVISQTMIMASVILSSDYFELVADNIEIELDNQCSFNIDLLH